jgi:hypothetical protein
MSDPNPLMEPGGDLTGKGWLTAGCIWFVIIFLCMIVGQCGHIDCGSSSVIDDTVEPL